MTRKQKRLAQLRQNPKNVAFDEVRQVLEDYGFILKRSSGSHHIFAAEAGGQVWTVIIPYRKPHIKAVYIKRALVTIDQIIANQDPGGTEDDEF